ncbi:N-alpha-acetyltransferase 40 [Tritrichomonas foetus]|uniref:N-alpha-acetyltransferase 40 n=1 Tax=Tritrichomonas foetus TaxID=1144522 RepID=A0A1J4JK76_9EUKA|nr:N-alpha-acetyltransferase 40 [Tritrichomonas foetus]|eukprot:OHS99009.1 N-alpha-acetyltransferase 40 [Tritrichomonas foetus]
MIKWPEKEISFKKRMQKKSKAQLRKEKLRQETELLNQKMQKIKDANANPDNLSDLPMFQKFNKNGISAVFKYYQHCPEESKEWVFDLTRRNMQELYEKTWGWNEGKKKRELFDDEARYLILTEEESNKPIGFVHIRFEYENNTLREYIYEFQVEPEYQGKGVGRFMMQASEFIALKRGMEAVMLTVFRINTGAMAFYRKMNYGPHEISPSISDPAHLDDYDYEVFYKSLVKKQ